MAARPARVAALLVVLALAQQASAAGSPGAGIPAGAAALGGASQLLGFKATKSIGAVQKPPMEVPVPVVEWKPVTVLTPSMTVYKMGFCIPRTQWTTQQADAVDCPPMTYMQQQNGQTVCARTACAGPVGGDNQPSLKQQKSTVLGAAYTALQKSIAKPWGGSAASFCGTVTVKPIMACPTGCMPDARQGQDACLCEAGQMACPYNYQSCPCSEYTLCVADSYWCDLYCRYTPSWYYGLVARGERACPIDPSLIDPLQPDPIFPGFAAAGGPTGR